jgi:hypothetical protein
MGEGKYFLAGCGEREVVAAPFSGDPRIHAADRGRSNPAATPSRSPRDYYSSFSLSFALFLVEVYVATNSLSCIFGNKVLSPVFSMRALQRRRLGISNYRSPTCSWTSALCVDTASNKEATHT